MKHANKLRIASAATVIAGVAANQAPVAQANPVEQSDVKLDRAINTARVVGKTATTEVLGEMQAQVRRGGELTNNVTDGLVTIALAGEQQENEPTVNVVYNQLEDTLSVFGTNHNQTNMLQTSFGISEKAAGVLDGKLEAGKIGIKAVNKAIEADSTFQSMAVTDQAGSGQLENLEFHRNTAFYSTDESAAAIATRQQALGVARDTRAVTGFLTGMGDV